MFTSVSAKAFHILLVIYATDFGDLVCSSALVLTLIFSVFLLSQQVHLCDKAIEDGLALVWKREKLLLFVSQLLERLGLAVLWLPWLGDCWTLVAFHFRFRSLSFVLLPFIRGWPWVCLLFCLCFVNWFPHYERRHLWPLGSVILLRVFMGSGSVLGPSFSSHSWWWARPVSLELALLRTYTSGRQELLTLSGGEEADFWA